MNYRITIRLSSRLRKQLKRLSQQHHCNKSKLIRSLINEPGKSLIRKNVDTNKLVRAVEAKTDELNQIHNELYRTGNNLNQLARNTNVARYEGQDMSEAMLGLGKILIEFTKIKKMLSHDNEGHRTQS